MTYRVATIVLTISIVFLMRKYWIARDEKDLCIINLDNHVKYIKELKTENEENRKSQDKREQSFEEQLESVKKEKINAESKLRLCENVSQKKDSDLR